MKREKTKLRQAVRRLSVCAARLAEEAAAASILSLKKMPREQIVRARTAFYA